MLICNAFIVSIKKAPKTTISIRLSIAQFMQEEAETVMTLSEVLYLPN